MRAPHPRPWRTRAPSLTAAAAAATQPVEGQVRKIHPRFTQQQRKADMTKERRVRCLAGSAVQLRPASRRRPRAQTWILRVLKLGVSSIDWCLATALAELAARSRTSGRRTHAGRQAAADACSGPRPHKPPFTPSPPPTGPATNACPIHEHNTLPCNLKAQVQAAPPVLGSILMPTHTGIRVQCNHREKTVP